MTTLSKRTAATAATMETVAHVDVDKEYEIPKPECDEDYFLWRRINKGFEPPPTPFVVGGALQLLVDKELMHPNHWVSQDTTNC